MPQYFLTKHFLPGPTTRQRSLLFTSLMQENHTGSLWSELAPGPIDYPLHSEKRLTSWGLELWEIVNALSGNWPVVEKKGSVGSAVVFERGELSGVLISVFCRKQQMQWIALKKEAKPTVRAEVPTQTVPRVSLFLSVM